MTLQQDPILNFSHLLVGDDASFPQCCGNGYFLLWDSHFESPNDLEMLDHYEALLREELSNMKQLPRNQ